MCKQGIERKKERKKREIRRDRVEEREVRKREKEEEREKERAESRVEEALFGFKRERKEIYGLVRREQGKARRERGSLWANSIVSLSSLSRPQTFFSASQGSFKAYV